LKTEKLSIRNLCFETGGKKILDDISISVKQGEFVGLIGPNGSGKTTLLKCIGGLYQGSGLIEIDGRDVSRMDLKGLARQASLMHQNTEISFPLPSLDIVLTGRYPHMKRLQHESRDDIAIARKYMDYTDTLQFEKRPINGVSGGERQRVLFAKSLAQEAELILLDEPAASLDISHEEQIFKYSMEQCMKGKTVVAAVHDLRTAVRYCTRFVLIKQGSILADGSSEEVLTSENISKAYGVNALVYKNRITGLLDFHIHGIKDARPGKTVHIIGGGGSAAGVLRTLYEIGHTATAGVFFPGDSDLECAEVFGVSHVICRPFSDIDEEVFNANVEMIRNADLTILCGMPFGLQNIRNLEAAKYAAKLAIIEDDCPASRDFTEGKALKLYEELKKSAVVTTTARLQEVL
jgi:iron complex transport system ATP-binding protein